MTDSSDQYGLLYNCAVAAKGLLGSYEETSKLGHLLHELDDETLKIPDHQRSQDAWDKKKQEVWIQRLKDTVSGITQPPLGVVCLYQIEGQTNGRWYLNDGLQRLSTSRKFKEEPEAYHFSRENVNQVLSIQMHVQKRVYRTREQAVNDFIAVNNGTGILDSEKYVSHIVYHDKYRYWKPRLEEWNVTLENALMRFSKNASGRRKAQKDGEKAWRYVWSLAFGGGPINNDLGDAVEKAVAQSLDRATTSDFERNLKAAKEHIAQIEAAWRKYMPDHARVMQLTCARWLLALRFLHPDVPTLWWNDFYAKLFDNTKGKSSIRNDENGNSHFLSKKLDLFSKVCSLLAIEPPYKQRRRRPNHLLQEGYQGDHEMPFADYGEAPTVSLPARVNAAKSARIWPAA